jgi:murein DD-endopeptidase MepM/ murein hydrolase activator NlpD
VKRVQAAAALLACGVVAAGIAVAAEPPLATHASATVVQVVVPGQAGASAGSVSAPPASSSPSAGFVYPADGTVVRLGASSSSAAAQAGTSASAQGVADALGASFFNGEITADAVSARATSAAGAANASAVTAGSSVSGLVVLGQSVTATPGLQVPLADWGVLEVLAGSGESTASAPRRAEAAITALRLRIHAAHGGLPAGSEVVLGVAEAVAEAAPAQPATPPAAAPAKPSSPPPSPLPPPPRGVRDTDNAPAPPPREPGRSRSGGAPDALVQPVPEGVLPKASTGGYVFPVYGPASFGDSFSAPRGAYVGGWHHGEDIFAPLGTPLLAVADGTVFSVGWNQYGGWRLWLRDRQGNQFYYAHLSAFSPLAVDGRAVKAGSVLGFMGRTGDAEHSPPHLHFEIHPVPLLHLGYDGVIAPYPYLIAWRRAEDISFAAGRAYLPEQGRPGSLQTPPVGAMLLEASDISRASGLVPGALERALADRRAGEATLAVPGR